MTETLLRTRIHTLAYVLCMLSFAMLAYFNLLYGFYPFFYTALVLIALAASGVGYTLWARRRQLTASGHGIILAAMALAVLALNLYQAELAVFWLFPLILLALLLLPLHRGLLLAGLAILFPGLAMLAQPQGLLAVSSLLSALLLGAMAAVFAYRYHHHARSVGELTTTDAITGAFNERYFDETLRREISRSESTGHPLSLIHLAIDYYTELENMHGETALHGLLEHVSDALRRTIRAGDSHYYVGHGEFLLLLPFTPEEGVRVIAERIRRVVAEGHWPVVEATTACLGGVSWHPGDQSPEELVASASRALEEAQRRGHNRIYHLDPYATRSAGQPASPGDDADRGDAL